MRARTAQWMAGGVAACSIALMTGGMVLAYMDRHALPAGLTNWDFTDVFTDVVNMAVPVLGFVLASRRPANRMGWLFLAAGLALALGTFTDPYALHALRVAPGCAVRLRLHRTGELDVLRRDGTWRSGRVRAGSFVAPWLTIVRWRPDGTRRDHTVLLLPDMAADDALRRLRVVLRWGAS